MSRHVVWTFVRVPVQRTVLRDKRIQEAAHVSPDFRFHALVDGKTGRGVQQEQVGDADRE